MATKAERRSRPALLLDPDDIEKYADYAIRCGECKHAGDKAKGKDKSVIWCLVFRRQMGSIQLRTCPKFERG